MSTDLQSRYVHPQETWSEKKCEKRSRSAPANHRGDRPPRGLINSSSNVHPQYGQTARWNGGTVIGNEWYQSEEVPLPIIPDSYEFVQLCSWGTRIQRKPNPPN